MNRSDEPSESDIDEDGVDRAQIRAMLEQGALFKAEMQGQPRPAQ